MKKVYVILTIFLGLMVGSSACFASDPYDPRSFPNEFGEFQIDDYETFTEFVTETVTKEESGFISKHEYNEARESLDWYLNHSGMMNDAETKKEDRIARKKIARVYGAIRLEIIFNKIVRGFDEDPEKGYDKFVMKFGNTLGLVVLEERIQKIFKEVQTGKHRDILTDDQVDEIEKNATRPPLSREFLLDYYYTNKKI